MTIELKTTLNGYEYTVATYQDGSFLEAARLRFREAAVRYRSSQHDRWALTANRILSGPIPRHLGEVNHFF